MRGCTFFGLHHAAQEPEPDPGRGLWPREVVHCGHDPSRREKEAASSSGSAVGWGPGERGKKKKKKSLGKQTPHKLRDFPVTFPKDSKLFL